MVEVLGNMVLYFEGDSTGNGKEFLRLLQKRWPDRIVIGKDTEYGTEVQMKVKSSTLQHHYVLFYHSSGPIPNLPNTSYLILEPYVLEYDHADEVKLYHEIFFAACLEFKPVFGSVHPAMYELDRPVIDELEYYENPYMFCFEPPSFYRTFDPKSFHAFIHDKGLVAKLAEIEKVMGRDELIKIIEQRVERVVINNDGGVGVLKNKYPQPCYPRYFIRQEARRRGVQLDEGLAEKYARKYGVK